MTDGGGFSDTTMKNLNINNQYTTLEQFCQQLTTYNQWILWKLEPRENKLAKIPYQINGYKAKTNDPTTWTTYKTALTTFQSTNLYSGIGFVFTNLDDFVFVDLDNCFDSRGSLNGHSNLVSDFIDTGAFVEKSISGNGLHIIGRAKLSRALVDKQHNLEIYPHGRFVALTGDVYAYSNEMGSCQEIINKLCGTTTEFQIKTPVKIIEVANVPIPLMRQNNMPYSFWKKIDWLKTATKGQGYLNYRSRSEVEFSCLLTLIKYGRNYSDASKLFEGLKFGHYMELGNNRFTYLQNQWDVAIKKFINTPTRLDIVNRFNNLPIFRLSSDLNIFKALHVSAYMADFLEFSVSHRSLAILAGVSRPTVVNSLRRLIDGGLLKRVSGKVGIRSTRYMLLNSFASTRTQNISHTGKGIELSHYSRLFKGIGGSSQQVYMALTNIPQSTKEIANKIGKCPNTARVNLKRLEFFSMAFGLKEGWIKGDVDLIGVMNMLGVSEDVTEHKEKIEMERLRDREKYKEYKKTLQSEENKAIIEQKENADE